VRIHVAGEFSHTVVGRLLDDVAASAALHDTAPFADRDLVAELECRVEVVAREQDRLAARSCNPSSSSGSALTVQKARTGAIWPRASGGAMREQSSLTQGPHDFIISSQFE
jgi:hypothetical protein